MPAFSIVLRAALVPLALVVCSRTAASQQLGTITDARLHKAPGGVVLATVPKGTPVSAGRRENGWAELTLEGWVPVSRVEKTTRDGFDLQVDAQGEELRGQPDGAVRARLRGGTLLNELSRRGAWVRVRRTGWVAAGDLGPLTPAKPATPPAAPPSVASAPPTAPKPAAPTPRDSARRGGGTSPTPAPTTATSPPATDDAERGAAQRATPLVGTPGGTQIGTLARGAVVRIGERRSEWTKVTLEGWVKADDIGAEAGGPMPGVTAEEVRSDPQRYVGQVVQWRLQVIAVRLADELRPELSPREPYLITRGPLPEAGFVYVALPPALLERARALPALSEITARVRIRHARTRFLQTPVVELVSFFS